MLKPINAAAVLRNGRATGLHPDQIHAGVAWWLGACFVVTLRVANVAVAHDGHVISSEYAARFARGAANAQHYRCHVTVFTAPMTQDELVKHARGAGNTPSGHITTSPSGEVTIALFDAQGTPLTDEAGMAKIRDLIERDRVPIPVNNSSRGLIEHRGEAGAR
ncbi:hypothetical protein ACIQAC_36510 [Streptomyces sp. NPDC088387]|uniref:hypothetical protein n=1 Tax=Streptomyces sp. NPDC088387 TaxID=3365859 RepID=UPI00382B284A